MGYSIRTTKTATGKYFANVNTGAYGSGYSVHRTEEFPTATEAYQAATAWKAERAAANKAKKADKAATGMTCQCCGRRHMANNGLVAHHGYERPGYGWQTASCYGARSLPFEADRETLGSMIKVLIGRRELMVNHREATAAETVGVRRNWTTGHKPKISHSFEFTRANFDSSDARDAKRAIGIYSDFDGLLSNELEHQDRAISNITRDINECQKRYDGWKQTHRWDAETKEWRKV